MPNLATDRNPVTSTPAAEADVALAHFSRLLQLESDCWDVHVAMTRGLGGFTVPDVRSPEAYANGHVPGAHNLPLARISERALAGFRDDTLFVVYCTGPHCNGADRAAVAIARLARPVKKMLGGMSGWREEAFAIETTPGGAQ